MGGRSIRTTGLPIQHPAAAGSIPTGTPALRFDVIAGLTAAAVVPPKAMACATVAGLPVLEVVRRDGLADRLGRERMLFNARAAIRQYESLRGAAS